MFLAKSQIGSSVLSAAYDNLHIGSTTKSKVVSKFLGITEATLKKWVSGKMQPPNAVVYALWHESDYGRQATQYHSEHGMDLFRRLSECQARDIEQMRKTIEFLNAELEAAKLNSTSSIPHAMNEPYFKRR
jgi:hypothetical protein